MSKVRDDLERNLEKGPETPMRDYGSSYMYLCSAVIELYAQEHGIDDWQETDIFALEVYDWVEGLVEKSDEEDILRGRSDG